MPELRWALIGLGVLFIAGLALWEWRRSRRRYAQAAAESAAGGVAPQVGEGWPRRIEPHIDGLATGTAPRATAEPLLEEVPVIHPTHGPVEVSLRVAPEAAVDVPAAVTPAPAIATPPAAPEPPPVAAQIRWPPERADRVLTLRLANAQGALLQGRSVRLALEQVGLVHGPQCIYHRVDEAGAVLVSAANMLRPGDLDPQVMDEQQFRGLSLFSVLPGALPPVRMLEELVAVARAVAWRLNAVVQDDHGAELDGDRLVKLRQSLPDAPEHGTA